jgi:hypothetical protein
MNLPCSGRVNPTMLRYLPIVPFAAFLALVACTGSDPVAEDAGNVPDELLGDASAEGLAAPGNAAAAERARQQRMPVQSGMAWSYLANMRTAQFGVPDGEPALSFQCRDAADGERELVVVRGTMAPDGEKGTLSFTGNGTAASLPVRGISPRRGKTSWQAVVPAGDMARAVARTFGSAGAVQVGVSGGSALSVPASVEARTVFADCLGG